MQNRMVRNGLVVGIILIFLGVAIVPSINGSNYVLNEKNQEQILEKTNNNCFIIGKTTYTTFGCNLMPPFGRKIGLGLSELLFGFDISAEGWILSIGRNGIQTWDGLLKGNLSIRYRFIRNYPKIGGGLYEIYDGIEGFKGIKLFSRKSGETFFMGFARNVKIIENIGREK